MPVIIDFEKKKPEGPLGLTEFNPSKHLTIAQQIEAQKPDPLYPCVDEGCPHYGTTHTHAKMVPKKMSAEDFNALSETAQEDTMKMLEEPEAALVLVIDADEYRLLGWTGFNLNEEIQNGSNGGSDFPLMDVPNEHGYYVVEDVAYLPPHQDYEGNYSDPEMVGTWRVAVPVDFEHFGVKYPKILENFAKTVGHPLGWTGTV